MIKILKGSFFLIATSILFIGCTKEIKISSSLSGHTDIFEGNITLRTQQQIDEFGSQGYSEIMGYLLIEQDQTSTDTIKDLSKLNKLTAIKGGLSISNNFGLKNLKGLDNLTIVNDSLKINNNRILIGISLNKIKTIEGRVNISENAKLSNLLGLDNLKIVHGDFNLSLNPKLENLEGLDKLEVIEGRFRIYKNALIASLRGLGSLNSVNSFSISTNALLENIGYLNNLKHVNGTLSVSKNRSLISLTGFESLSFVGGNLSIKANTQLKDFCALKNLLTSGELRGLYKVSLNAYNPTREQIVAGECSP